MISTQPPSLEATMPEWSAKPQRILSVARSEGKTSELSHQSADCQDEAVAAFQKADDPFGMTLGNVDSALQGRPFLSGVIRFAPASPESQQDLVHERQALLKRKFGPGLSRSEEQHLKLLEWKLDRLDSIRYKDSLEGLEAMVAQQEAIARQLQQEMQRLHRSS